MQSDVKPSAGDMLEPYYAKQAAEAAHPPAPVSGDLVNTSVVGRYSSLQSRELAVAKAVVEACAKVANERRKYFVVGPDVRTSVSFSATEAGDAIRALDPNAIVKGMGEQERMG